MVGVYTIEGDIILDTSKFESSISVVTGELQKLNTSFNKPLDTANFVNSMDTIRGEFNSLKVIAKEINTMFNNIINVSKVVEELNRIKAELSSIQQGATKIGNIEKKNEATLGNIGKQVIRIGSEIKKNLTYEEEMVATEKLFQEAVGQSIADKFRLNAEIQKSNELYMQNLEMEKASANLEKEMLTFLTEENGLIQQITGSHEKSMNTIKEELALEEKKLGVIEEETAMLNEQGAVRQRNVTKVNQLDKMGYLPRRVGSMAVTMLGYQEIMDVWEKTTTNINAKGSYAHFGKQLQTDERYLKQTGQTSTQVAKSLNGLDGQLRDLQNTYKKIDMKTVGANAEETAFKYGLQADAIGDLSEVMAIYGSEFVKQGRTQEESILALNDALDGELRRLKEVNVTSNELKEHGWKGQGDQIGMIKALQEIAEERGYDVTAKEITNLSDAITYAELQLAFLLSDLFEIAEPSIRDAVIKLAEGFQWLGEKVAILKDYLQSLDPQTKQFLKQWGTNSILIGGFALIGKKFLDFVGGTKLLGKGWDFLMKKLGRTKGIDTATESLDKLGNATTGGTAPTGDGNWKTGLKNWGKNLVKNLGKMAEIFIEVAVALAMAWALLKESMYIISDLGKQWESEKENFNKGMEFLKEYGIWILGISAVLGYWFSTMSNVPVETQNYYNMARNFGKVALGLVLAMLLISEAIVLLNAPLLTIASIGAVANWQQGNIDKGIEVIQWMADALNQITPSVGVFLIALGVASVILGYAPEIGIGIGVGIAVSLGLVAEAIGLLIMPLVAIEMLGEMANELNQDAINRGAEAIRIVGECLKALEPSIRNLLYIDLEVFGVNLVDWGNKLITGKTGLESLVDEIIPNLIDFVKKFNQLEMGEPVDQAKVQAVTQMATDIPPLFNAMQNLNNAMGTNNLLGNIGGAIGGGISGMIGMGLKSKLDQLYNDVRDVMDFATKLGGLQGSAGANANVITQTANAIAQLKAKLDLMVSTITTSSAKVKSASNQLGSALTNGFKEGSNGFSASVVQMLAKGISEVQSRYNTFHSGGKTLGDKLSDGFEDGADLKSSTTKELGYALQELENHRDDFYNKGKSLGEELSRGYDDGVDMHSPGRLARTTASEMGFIMEALDNGRQMMYNGGVALGQALYNGYNSTGNIRTNVDVLASKGISNEQLQATARNIQANTNKGKQVPQLSSNTINIDMSNSTVIGIQDLDNKIRQAVEKAIVNINSPNGAIGY